MPCRLVRCLPLVAFTLVLWNGSTLIRAADDNDANSKTAAMLKLFVDEFVAITPGEGRFPKSFQMGFATGPANERPVHKVTFTHKFAIAKYEVPQNLYEAVMGNNPSRWKGPRNSVEMMSWKDAKLFCQKITVALRDQKLIADTDEIRLPTEAEWEYCCRAGTTTRYGFGDEAQAKEDQGNKATLLDKFGWHTGNAAGNDPPVGALKPNAWGLYDMHGYLWEFTADDWSDDYEHASENGAAVSVDPNDGQIVMRSGSWKDKFDKLTSTTRQKFANTKADDAVGFRCVMGRVK